MADGVAVQHFLATLPTGELVEIDLTDAFWAALQDSYDDPMECFLAYCSNDGVLSQGDLERLGRELLGPEVNVVGIGKALGQVNFARFREFWTDPKGMIERRDDERRLRVQRQEFRRISAARRIQAAWRCRVRLYSF